MVVKWKVHRMAMQTGTKTLNWEGRVEVKWESEMRTGQQKMRHMPNSCYLTRVCWKAR